MLMLNMAGSGSTGDKASSRMNGMPGHGKSASKNIGGERPSRDGSAQKAAEEVEGLKGYVSTLAIMLDWNGYMLIYL
jgi:hypothetical protein